MKNKKLLKNVKLFKFLSVYAEAYPGYFSPSMHSAITDIKEGQKNGLDSRLVEAVEVMKGLWYFENGDRKFR